LENLLSDEQKVYAELAQMAYKLSKLFAELIIETDEDKRMKLAEDINELMEKMDNLIEDEFGLDEDKVIN
jgi:hypothetical protein